MVAICAYTTLPPHARDSVYFLVASPFPLAPPLPSISVPLCAPTIGASSHSNASTTSNDTKPRMHRPSFRQVVLCRAMSCDAMSFASTPFYCLSHKATILRVHRSCQCQRSAQPHMCLKSFPTPHRHGFPALTLAFASPCAPFQCVRV